MCEEADEFNEVQSETSHRARKPHKCCACDEMIAVGHKYYRTFTLYDGSVSTFKHCLRCMAMLNALHKALPSGTAIAWELNCGQDWRNTIGDLPDDVARLAFLTADEAQAVLARGTA